MDTPFPLGLYAYARQLNERSRGDLNISEHLWCAAERQRVHSAKFLFRDHIKRVPREMASNVESSIDHFSIDTWTARRTPDNRVSVIDVISHVTGKHHRYASDLYNRLVVEERISPCTMHNMPPKAISAVSGPTRHG